MKAKFYATKTLCNFLFATLLLLISVSFPNNKSMGQNLVTSSYANSGPWYTVASNCKLDTVAGAGIIYPNTTQYLSSTTPKAQYFGTRADGVVGLNGDGTVGKAGTNLTAGRYFEFAVSPINSFYSIRVDSISLSAFVNGTATTYGAVVYSTDGGTNWTSIDGRSLTLVATATTPGAGSLLATTSASVATPTNFRFNFGGTPLTVSSGNF